ncbi:hypothetical protein EVAR_27647_1 [Eumeta japonica]|uniref:Peptidase S1 domain-containing protein n=1 Tax=Eumeta variegata TaxID=151549 RepID=A0A4C1V0E5_EUMVA|nr:hypothetical protein EVAR_27647_1 [Eumeta japonica]
MKCLASNLIRLCYMLPVKAIATKGHNERSIEIEETSKLGQLKHHVFIFMPRDLRKRQYKAFCSGTIISAQKVVSAARCFLTNRKRSEFQGSYAGLYNQTNLLGLILDFLLRELGDLGVYIHAFVDDVVLMFSGQSASSAEEDGQRAYRVNLSSIQVVAAILYTLAVKPHEDGTQQWRSVKTLYSPRYFRYP